MLFDYYQSVFIAFIYIAALTALVSAAGVAFYRDRRLYLGLFFAAATLAMIAAVMHQYAVNVTLQEVFDEKRQVVGAKISQPKQPWLMISYYMNPTANIIAIIASIAFILDRSKGSDSPLQRAS